jgi:hypothetical protein
LHCYPSVNHLLKKNTVYIKILFNYFFFANYPFCPWTLLLFSDKETQQHNNPENALFMCFSTQKAFALYNPEACAIILYVGASNTLWTFIHHHIYRNHANTRWTIDQQLLWEIKIKHYFLIVESRWFLLQYLTYKI